MKKVLVILGTGREGRLSERVSSAVMTRLDDNGLEARLVDVRDYDLSYTQAGKESVDIEKYRELVGWAEAILVVVPEYNRSYPGEMKLLMDYLYKEYEGKLGAVVGVSSGRLGAGRVIEAMQQYFADFGMETLDVTVGVAKVNEAFGEDGEILDEKYRDRLDELVEAIKDK